MRMATMIELKGRSPGGFPALPPVAAFRLGALIAQQGRQLPQGHIQLFDLFFLFADFRLFVTQPMLPDPA
jgi:hypothetical protein